MKLFLEKTDREQEIEFAGTVQELLNHLHINPATVLVARNDELLTESDHVSGRDSIKILSVISGG